MRFPPAALLAALLLSCGGPLHDHRQPLFDVEVSHGIVYGSGAVQAPAPGDADLLLDLYEPSGAGLPDSLPGLVIIHGGGFIGGSRGQDALVDMARGMAARGYVVASIDYRLEGDDPLPGPRMQNLFEGIGGAGASAWSRAIVCAVDDTLSAFDWLHLHAGDLSLDTDRIALLGGSAGAITAIHMAYLMDEWDIPVHPVSAVIDFWGALFFSVNDPSPLEAGEPPLFAVHGTRDMTVALAWNQDLIERAQEVGVPHEWHPIEGAGHGFGAIDPMTVEVAPGVTIFDRIVEFSYAAAYTPGCLERTVPVSMVNVIDADGDGIGNVCDGDFNDDGHVGGPDFDVFLACFGAEPGPGAGPAADPSCGESDMNGDGLVGGPDFDLFLQGFGGPPGA